MHHIRSRLPNALLLLCNTVDNAVAYSAGWETDQWPAEVGEVGKSKVAGSGRWKDKRRSRKERIQQKPKG